MIAHQFKVGLSFVAAVILPVFLASKALALPLAPQVDFRDQAFAGANLSHSFSSEVDGVGFTVSAWREGLDGAQEEALIWWDDRDGLGIWGDEDDEIDAGETLKIVFDSLIGISHLFFADLFALEQWGGFVYDESGSILTDFGFGATFSALDLFGSWGDAANGEAVLELDKSRPVTEILISVPKNLLGHQNFALLGFIDPEPELPLPATLPLLLIGLAGLGLLGRRRPS